MEDKQIIFTCTCLICGKKFKTENPVQEACIECINEFSDFLVQCDKPVKNYNKYLDNC